MCTCEQPQATGSEWYAIPGGRERLWFCHVCGEDLPAETEGGYSASLIQY
jgi:hypothetical protein